MPKVDNWRTDPDIQRCKAVASETGAEIVIIIQFMDDGRCEAHSYGKSGKLCALGGKILDEVADVAEWAYADAGSQP